MTLRGELNALSDVQPTVPPTSAAAVGLEHELVGVPTHVEMELVVVLSLAVGGVVIEILTALVLDLRPVVVLLAVTPTTTLMSPELSCGALVSSENGVVICP